ncbi:hypothetical protein BDP27DRAFT_364282 [Rhodocollybia butyracea]|uniref:Uncharacterized protein n=1 Tax=Rhodocollybia butyracea TaxID=206335 RepID=A0A9P5P9E5_9AGAR|nr:hypothetical protein BDP27DRAFT_364282 [Rhodocollybia butyracea]
MFALSKPTTAIAIALGTPYTIASNLNDTLVWLFNGASEGTPNAIHLVPLPPTVSSTWILTSTSDGGWTISEGPVDCVAAPADSLLTTNTCENAAGTDIDFAISCATCTGNEATGCTLIAASTNDCVTVPSASDPNDQVRTLECTGTAEELWDFFN